jgi:hypothetical protein
LGDFSAAANCTTRSLMKNTPALAASSSSASCAAAEHYQHTTIINNQTNNQTNKQSNKQQTRCQITLRSPSLPTNGATTGAALRVEKPGVRVATTLITAIISRYTWKFASFHPGDAYQRRRQYWFTTTFIR